jgi:23S rRNA C2498 (ribose-2'-O)-methylase RlmM
MFLKNTTFRKLDLFPSSGKMITVPTLLSPLDSACVRNPKCAIKAAIRSRAYIAVNMLSKSASVTYEFIPKFATSTYEVTNDTISRRLGIPQLEFISDTVSNSSMQSNRISRTTYNSLDTLRKKEPREMSMVLL